MIPDAESIDLEVIEQPEIRKVAGSTKAEFVSELWNQGYKLAEFWAEQQRVHSTRNLPIDGAVKIGISFILEGWVKMGQKKWFWNFQNYRFISLGDKNILIYVFVILP